MDMNDYTQMLLIIHTLWQIWDGTPLDNEDSLKYLKEIIKSIGYNPDTFLELEITSAIQIIARDLGNVDLNSVGGVQYSSYCKICGRFFTKESEDEFTPNGSEYGCPCSDEKDMMKWR